MLRVSAGFMVMAVVLAGCSQSTDESSVTQQAAKQEHSEAAPSGTDTTAGVAKQSPAKTKTAADPQTPIADPNPEDAALRTTVQELLAQMSSDADVERNAARDKLDALGESAIRYVVGALESGTPAQQVGAATFLVGRVSPRDRAAQRALIEALGAEHDVLRHQALQAVEKLGAEDLVQALAGLTAMAQNQSEVEAYRVRAVRAISKLGSAGGVSTDALRQLAEGDPSLDVRKSCFYAISKVAPAVAAERFYQSQLQSNEVPELRRLAAKWLNNVATTDASVRVLVAALSDAEESVRLECVDTLVALGKPALASLVKALDASDVQTRRHAVVAIGKLGYLGQDAIPALKAHLNDPDPQVRELTQAAIDALNSFK